MSEIVLDREQYFELEKLADGAYYPLTGFMNEDNFASVVDTMRLSDGTPFPIPILLDVSRHEGARMRGLPRVALVFEGEEVGLLEPESLYSWDKAAVASKLFGCDDAEHAGVALFSKMKDMFVGGPVTMTKRVELDISRHYLTPEETKRIFGEREWQSVAGFHTRSAPHRAHEWLHRLALELCDGLLIHPMLGRKKKGDYSPSAITRGYRALIGNFYPTERVLFSGLTAYPRYGGPREAVFHCIVRRNFGCTHFIVGRDHAGVGQYYGRYASQELCDQFRGELGIDVLTPREPYHCKMCEGIVTERTCPHLESHPEATIKVSGTANRSIVLKGESPPAYIMRPEVWNNLGENPLILYE
jgi:sulfate adenylyltransferase